MTPHSPAGARPTLTLLTFPSQATAGSAPLNARQQDILDVIAAASEPVSTGDVLKRINADRTTTLVLEQVYRALRALHDRALIERVDVKRASRVHWQLTTTQHRGPLNPLAHSAIQR